ncbi:6-phosphogluconolactonase [Lichenicoccus sp.]|uniref:6-phosphogluconolactonase n=1 Tax=Lichenicoccus sp. TaxID=2781899 RepID=UPI003D100707
MTDVAEGREWILPDAQAVARRVAEFLFERARAKPGDAPYVIALSGGSTPKRLYEILAAAPFATEFPWSRLELFFGDERFVPPDSADSNYNMVNRALLSHVPVPSERVHRMPAEGDPAQAARSYQRELRAVYGSDALQPGRPLFDVVLLGLGENGHTASLFPGTAVLEERTAWVSTCTPHDAPHRRLTLTYPAIHSSAYVLFLVTGAGKAEVLGKVRARDPAQPSSHITTEGELVWVLDEAAAGKSDAEKRDG